MGLFKKKQETFEAPTPHNSKPFYLRIPYSIVNNDHIILDDFSIMWSYEIRPQYFEGFDKNTVEIETNKIATLLKNLTTPNVFIQWTVLVSNDNEELFQKHKKAVEKSPILSGFADEKMEMLKDSINFRIFLSLIVPLSAAVSVDGKKKKVFDQEDFERRNRNLKQAHDAVFDTLVPLNYNIEKLTGYQHMSLVYSILNPGCKPPDMKLADYGGRLMPLNKRIFASDFFVEQYFITNGQVKFATLTMDLQPQPVQPMALSYVLKDLSFPVLMNFCILNEDANRVNSTLEGQRKLAVLFSGKKSSAAVENKEKVDAIEQLRGDRAKEGFKIMRVFCSIVVWDADEVRLNEKIGKIRTTCTRHLEGVGIFAEWLRKETALAASLPGCAARSFDLLYMDSPQIANMLPLRLQFSGEPKRPTMLQTNRWSGITAFDMFSEYQNRWAGVIIGPTGSGKSHFMNEQILSVTALDPVINIFDLATEPSYEPIMNILGGAMIKVDFSDNTNRVNMFDLRLGMQKPIGSKLMSLNAMLTVMLQDAAAQQNHLVELPKVEQSLLFRAIDRLYTRVFKEEPIKIKGRHAPEALEYLEKDLPIGLRQSAKFFYEYADYYTEKFIDTKNIDFYRKAEVAHSLCCPVLGDLVKTFGSDGAFNSTLSDSDKALAQVMLGKLNLYATGEWSKLFSGPTNFVVDNDYFCFHLGPVRSEKEALRLLLLIYRDFAWRKSVFSYDELPEFMQKMDVSWIIRRQNREKFFLYDEFHNLKNDAVILSVLDKDARQQRTLKMGTYLATQTISDVSEGGAHFLGASSNKFFTRHIDPDNPDAEAINKVVKTLGLNKDAEELLKSLNFYPGKYAEILCICEGLGVGVIKSEPSPLKRWLFSTHGDERYIRDNIARMLISQHDIPRQKAFLLTARGLAHHYPNGMIGRTDIILDDIVNNVLKYMKMDGYY